jgi:hypothetical protein
MYTDTTNIDRSGSRNTAVVRSSDCFATCSLRYLGGSRAYSRILISPDTRPLALS